MLQAGLCSVTFRQLAVFEIVDLVADTGLAGIEWGGDVHVPHGELDRARQTKRLCADCGLTIAAYGSYYRLGERNDFDVDALLDTAEALGAPLIRVWPGKQGSADADADYRKYVADDARALLEAATGRNLRLAVEYHGNSLTDTPAAAADFLRAVDHPRLSTYWQMVRHRSQSGNLADLKQILPWLSNLHTFFYADGNQVPLAAGKPFWKEVLGTVGGDRWVLLEFVAGGDPEQFRQDAATLTEILKDIQPQHTE